MLSTPLYSNTTLVCFNPTLAGGGTVVLMRKFDAHGFLELAQKHRATHAMLVPVQYRRIMALPDFDRFDLSSFVMKFSTSAPFSAAIKADVLKRWPGGLTEYYGMTEGGGSFILLAHEHPNKLHTVGQPGPEHEILLMDEEGKPVAQGEIGEIYGHSPTIMDGYLNQPGKTADTFWHDANGKRYVRTGDVGRFDEDGFLTLMDRKKDMIISGGFNIYPSDLEAVLAQHSDVVEAAVVAMPSDEWGETPVAFVVLAPNAATDAERAQDLDQCARRQIPAARGCRDRRHAAAQRDRQSAQARIAGPAGWLLQTDRNRCGVTTLSPAISYIDIDLHQRRLSMGTTITFKRPDGKEAKGYLANASAGNAPGLVVIQEWWGLSGADQRA